MQIFFKCFLYRAEALYFCSFYHKAEALPKKIKGIEEKESLTTDKGITYGIS
jgi:hypothetical protein